MPGTFSTPRVSLLVRFLGDIGDMKSLLLRCVYLSAEVITGKHHIRETKSRADVT